MSAGKCEGPTLDSSVRKPQRQLARLHLASIALPHRRTDLEARPAKGRPAAAFGPSQNHGWGVSIGGSG